jgi:hypothetical protein
MPDCCPTEQLARQEYLEHLYTADGRHEKTHPQHGIYTGLFVQRQQQLVAADRMSARELLADDDHPLFAVLVPFIGAGLIADPEAARAICAAWCRGTSSRLVFTLERLKTPGHPADTALRAVSAWLLHEAMRAELGQ